MTRIAQISTAGMMDAQRRIDEKVNLKPDAFASEIRAMFRTLDINKQGEFVQKLVDSNRGPELAAIVKAPSVLTGITDAEKAAYENAIVGKHAPAEQQEIQHLEEAFEASWAAVKAASNLVKGFTDPVRLAEIEAATEAANAAGAAFDQALK